MPKFHDFHKCVHNKTNILIRKEQITFRSEKHKVFTVGNDDNGDDKEIQNDDGAATYPYGSNTSSIKHSDDKKYLVLFKN